MVEEMVKGWSVIMTLLFSRRWSRSALSVMPLVSVSSIILTTFALPLGADATTYRYRDNGVDCYTDNLANIPKKLRKSAEPLDKEDPVEQESTASTSLADEYASKAVGDLIKLATAGDTIAQNVLGNAYLDGRGVPIDNEKARYWYTQSAKAGYLIAQANLASLLLGGRYGYVIIPEGMTWLKTAADRGDAQSQYNLAREYDVATKVPRNYDEAKKYYEKAVEQGFLEAYVNLGLMYQYGKGVPQDFDKAQELYEVAAAAGIFEAKNNLKVLKQMAGRKGYK